MRDEQVVVVGAGAAGLSSAGALKRLGLAPVVLDRDASVGASWLRRYDRLHLHTVRGFSNLAHVGIPRRYPRYLSRSAYAEYLRFYRERLGIDVVQNCEVLAVRDERTAPDRPTGFVLETSTGDWRARAVVMATGMFAHPVQPQFEGLDGYRGHALHSSAYTTGGAYAGMRVLVVGIGNTGAEIAADLVEQAASSVAVSVRTAPAIVPRDFLGIPVQAFGILLSRLPGRVADRIAAAVARIALGDLTRYGLAKPQWLPFSAHRIPVIDVGFVRYLKSGRISIRPSIAKFHGRGVAYLDGSAEDFDAVIFATGYRTGLEDVLRVPGVLDQTGYPKSVSGAPGSRPGLYFMGFFESHRGLLFETAIASRILARNVARFLATGDAGGTCAVW